MNKIGDSAISERKTCPNNCDFSCTTVDGRIPTPVDMVDIPFFRRVSYMVGGGGFLRSTVLPLKWQSKALAPW